MSETIKRLRFRRGRICRNINVGKVNIGPVTEQFYRVIIILISRSTWRIETAAMNLRQIALFLSFCGHGALSALHSIEYRSVTSQKINLRNYGIWRDFQIERP